MGKTKIEWTDGGYTWNPIRVRNRKTGKIGWHCVHMSDGCRLCYAEGMNKRLGTGLAYKPGHERDIEIFVDDKMLAAPLRWRDPSLVFPCSMTDMFGDFVDVDTILCMIAVMAMTPHLTYQIVTKRPDRMCGLWSYFGRRWRETQWERQALAFAISGDPALADLAANSEWPLPNVWCGTSTEDQETYDQRSPWLFETPAAVRFISYEPMLGPLSLRAPFGGKLDWCIAGSESGSQARDRDDSYSWVRNLRDDCQRNGTALFVKQLPSLRRGKPFKDIAAFPEDLRIREFPKGAK